MSRTLALTLFVWLAAAPSFAAAPKSAPAHKPDLADGVAGSYSGDVISDSQGSGRQDVTLTVTRTGPNTISVTSDYPRLPVISVKLMRAMDKTLSATGDSNFLYDPTKMPAHLDVSFHNQVSWSGARQ